MRKLRFSFSILFVITLALILAASVSAQEPTPHPNRGKPTPTPPSQPGDTPIEPQIVGGQVASPGEYPWQAAIVSATDPNPQFGQFCGGSLIDTEWVLTAAHCVGGSSIDVVLGINNLSDGPTTGGQGQRIAVDKIIPFPGYTDPDGDLALLHLATPASLSATVALIGLAGPGDSALFEPGDTATVTGWGDTSWAGPPSNALLEVAVPIVSNATCNAPSSYNGAITANMLCAGLAAGGKDSCQGDSGGPLIVPNGQSWLQAGIVSWGDVLCASPNKYGVYTRISQFKSWIDSQIYTIYLPIIMKANS
jgi:secreted trypsin-like serine protease